MPTLKKCYYTTSQRFVIQIQKPAIYLVLICTMLFLTSQGVNYAHDVLPLGHNHVPLFKDENGDQIQIVDVYVPENEPNYLIGNIQAIDEDEDDTLTYRLMEEYHYYSLRPGHRLEYSDFYTINSETGEVRVGSAGLDFEAFPYTYHPTYKYQTIAVEVKDGNGGSRILWYQVYIIDVYEPPDPEINDPEETQEDNVASLPINILPRNANRVRITTQRTPVPPSPIHQDRVIFNEIRNAEDNKNDWIELKNISDEPISLKDWEISIVTPSEVRQVNKPEEAGKDEDIVSFPDYTLPVSGVLLIANTDPNETHLESGQDITDPESDPDVLPQYLVAPEMHLPDTSYLLILRSVRDNNGTPESVEDVVGVYFRESAYYATQIWPLRYTLKPFEWEKAELTQGQAWHRVAIEARGYTRAAWGLSGHQSGLGYKPDASVDTSLGTPGYPNDSVTDEGLVGRITMSEVMFATKGGLFSESQWIELYNNTSYAATPTNLKGWKLVIEARDSEVSHRYSVIELDELYIAPNQVVLLVTRNRKHSTPLTAEQIYDLYEHHGDILKLGLRDNKVLGWQGFGLRLYAPDGTLVDVAGNLDGKRGRDTPKWELPPGRTEDGVRTSLIRQYQNNSAQDSAETMSWVRATDMNIPVSGYYGHKTDISTPGYKESGSAPVMLSHFGRLGQNRGLSSSGRQRRS